MILMGRRVLASVALGLLAAGCGASGGTSGAPAGSATQSPGSPSVRPTSAPMRLSNCAAAPQALLQTLLGEAPPRPQASLMHGMLLCEWRAGGDWIVLDATSDTDQWPRKSVQDVYTAFRRFDAHDLVLRDGKAFEAGRVLTYMRAGYVIQLNVHSSHYSRGAALRFAESMSGEFARG